MIKVMYFDYNIEKQKIKLLRNTHNRNIFQGEKKYEGQSYSLWPNSK